MTSALQNDTVPRNSISAARASDAPPRTLAPAENCRRVFLLSPANASGVRAKMIVNQRAQFHLAQRLRQDGLPLGEIFSFVSGLYFRGKLAYARAFADVPPDLPGAFVITACRGLIPPETSFTVGDLREISSVPIEPSDARYRVPLERDAHALSATLGKNCEVVLLGSIATAKYVEPLLGIFGGRLVFPAEFAGRGDMSRGGLMLRAARDGRPLTYVPVATAERHGRRPPKLPKLPRPATHIKKLRD